MTDFHNPSTTNPSYNTSSFDWFERNQQEQQAQLPPINFHQQMPADVQQNMVLNDDRTRFTNMNYSSRESCDMSYEQQQTDEYHHNHGQPTPSPSASTERSGSHRSKKHRTPSTRDIHVEKNTEGKPPYSYATLIKYAIENSSRKKLTLSEIYQWVIDHYPYYGSAGTGWKNSIRHNLSLNKSFVRVPRPINEPGKGSYWQVDYRAAEAEQRSKSTMAVRGRANRSGSDPSTYNAVSTATSPYRPNNDYHARFNRDSRSLSLDSSATSQMLPTKGYHTQPTTPTTSTHSSGGSGYYYNTHQPYGAYNGARHHSISSGAPRYEYNMNYEYNKLHPQQYESSYNNMYPQQSNSSNSYYHIKEENTPMEENQHSFSTPQPYKRIVSPQPGSPPQPKTMIDNTKRAKKPASTNVANNGTNEYDWIA